MCGAAVADGGIDPPAAPSMPVCPDAGSPRRRAGGGEPRGAEGEGEGVPGGLSLGCFLNHRSNTRTHRHADAQTDAAATVFRKVYRGDSWATTRENREKEERGRGGRRRGRAERAGRQRKGGRGGKEELLRFKKLALLKSTTCLKC